MLQRRIPILMALALLVGAVAARPVGATPVDDRIAEATRLNQRILENGLRITALAEQYNGARVRLDEATRDLKSAQANYDAAKDDADGLRAAVDGRAQQLLKGHAAGSIRATDDVDLTDVERVVQRTKYARISGDLDREALNRLVYVLEDLAAKRKVLEELQATRKAEADTIQQAQDELKRANEEQLRTLAAITDELRAVMESEVDRQRSSLAAAFLAGQGPVRDAQPNARPQNLKAELAIAYAQAQLGKPYVYATKGPNTFDCSGLTKMAYEAVGVPMLHYSGYQYRDFPRVPLDALLPGDLVFWGENASQHVGLYIGGGLMIHAPQTGDVVKIAPVFRGVMGASRPWL
jgi:cell wall-associated NlpC family hydrolase